MIKITKNVNLQYWTRGLAEKNLGDYLGEVMLDFAGIKNTSEGRPTHFTIGTSLSSYWWRLNEGPKVIWGSGGCGFDLPHLGTQDEILAVRGPLTASWLGLPADVPLGDPALLLPRIYSPKKINCGPVLVENFHSKIDANKKELTSVKKTSMKITGNNWRSVVDEIYGSDFVLANSLHSSIIAQAYGKPWAFYADKESNIPLASRWKDWFAFLGLPDGSLRPVSDLVSAIKWWDENSRLIRARDLEKLVDCCPWPELRKILK